MNVKMVFTVAMIKLPAIIQLEVISVPVIWASLAMAQLVKVMILCDCV